MSNAELAERSKATTEPLHSTPISTLHAQASSCSVATRVLHNWGGSTQAKPERLFEPTSVEQCCALVELARRQGKELRAIGRAHSPSDLMWTRGWAVRMRGLQGVLSIDANALEITVLAGTFVSAIHEALGAASPPLAMSNVGSISEQTIGGLIATATHGTGLTRPVVSASVRAMKVIVALPIEQGGTQVVTCSPRERPELFNATLCSLGCTGLIVEVTLAVEHAFCLRQVAEEVPLDALLGPSTGWPAIMAMPPQPDFPANVKANLVDITEATQPERQSIGELLARGARLPTARSAYLPKVRNEETGSIHPAPRDDVARVDEDEDDVVTREAQARLHQIVSSSQHAKIMLWPQAGMATVIRQDRTLEPPVGPTLFARLHHRLIGHDLTQFLLYISRYHKSLPPRVARLVYTLTHGVAAQKVGARGSGAPNPPPRPGFISDSSSGEGLSAGGVQAGVGAVGRTTEALKSGQEAPLQEEQVEASHTSSAKKSSQASSQNASSSKSQVASVGWTTEEPASSGPGKRSTLAPAKRAPPATSARTSETATSETSESFEKFAAGPATQVALRRGTPTLTPTPGALSTTTLINTSHLVFNMDCLFPQHTDEWAIPFEHSAAALRALRDWLAAEEASDKGERLHFPVEVRFTDGDGIWLSHSQGRRTCFIGVIQFRPYNRPVRYRVLFARFEALMRHFAGRPHWAKSHTCGARELASLYPHMPDFLALREQVDPDGVFLNPYVRRHLLGEVGEEVGVRVFKKRQGAKL